MSPEAARKVAEQFIHFLETGHPQAGLFTDDVFCDFTLPLWRVQAQGFDQVVALRTQGHPGTSRVPRWRCDPTPTGFVMELEERWQHNGEEWYCREMIRADMVGDSISEISVYCTGDWDANRQAEHRQAVALLRE
ncbi:Nuclear transport factor 2 family protein [Gammaproteobacteria bacterium]